MGKGLIILVLLFAAMFAAAAAQWSRMYKSDAGMSSWSGLTVEPEPQDIPLVRYDDVRPQTTATIGGVSLFAAGTAMTFIPGARRLALNLRDAVQADGHSRFVVDDCVQYLPAALPPALSLCGLKSRHGFWKMGLLEGGSFLVGAGLLNAGKYSLCVTRPDGSSDNSFPSGHTFTAFTGAEVLRREYGTEYPWLAVTGYAVATMVGAMRIYNNRHWLGDVLAGAGLGILSTSLVYWIFD